MKRFFILAFALLLGTNLAFTQATGGSTDTKATTVDSGKKAHKGAKKGHKGGKKSSADDASKQEVNPQPLLPGIKTDSTSKTDAGPASAGDAQLSSQPPQPAGDTPIGGTNNKTKTKTQTKKDTKSSGDNNTGSTIPK